MTLQVMVIKQKKIAVGCLFSVFKKRSLALAKDGTPSLKNGHARF